MKRLTPVVLPLCAGLLAPATALAGDSLVSAIADGKTTLNLRLRHEQVDDDKFDKTAQASTLRARLGYLSKDWHGIGFGVEQRARERREQAGAREVLREQVDRALGATTGEREPSQATSQSASSA